MYIDKQICLEMFQTLKLGILYFIRTERGKRKLINPESELPLPKKKGKS